MEIIQILQDLAPLLVYPLTLLGGAYALCLWRLLQKLTNGLEILHANCQKMQRYLEANFLSAHQVEHQSLWEALHHHEHGPRRKPDRGLRIVGLQVKGD
uniref:Uncharacterized protein n=1 Tax=Desulfobacca acetoxidans TaxID=60893 RepID=A0A7C3SJL2_9BACT